MRPKRLARLTGICAAALSAAAIVVPAAQAATPAPGYTQFAGCPSKSEQPSAPITNCFRSTITSGYLKLGNKKTPIENPIILTGGTGEGLGTLYYNSKGGLLPVKEKVPGGVIGLTGLTWLAEFLGSEALTLYAEPQLVGTANVGFETTRLPIRVHLINGALGNNCYVGSSSNPIVLNLTTGTSGKLTGKEPELTFDFTTEILKAEKGTYVDGLFTAPGASGCTLTLFGFIPISINGLVNTASGLPAGSGVNETVQNFGAEFVERAKVYPTDS